MSLSDFKCTLNCSFCKKKLDKINKTKILIDNLANDFFTEINNITDKISEDINSTKNIGFISNKNKDKYKSELKQKLKTLVDDFDNKLKENPENDI